MYSRFWGYGTRIYVPCTLPCKNKNTAVLVETRSRIRTTTTKLVVMQKYYLSYIYTINIISCNSAHFFFHHIVYMYLIQTFIFLFLFHFFLQKFGHDITNSFTLSWFGTGVNRLIATLNVTRCVSEATLTLNA